MFNVNCKEKGLILQADFCEEFPDEIYIDD